MEDEMITSAQVDRIGILITRKGYVTNKKGDIMNVSWWQADNNWDISQQP